MIFVFGSNLAGIHGAGAAQFAHQHHGLLMIMESKNYGVY